ncbi:MAG: hypothetical protein U0174_20810 [Polyangiaceae bacterium]
MSDKEKDGTEEEFPWDADWDSALSEWEDNAFSDKNINEEGAPAAKAKPTAAQTQESPVFSDALLPPSSPTIAHSGREGAKDLDSVTQNIIVAEGRRRGGVLGAKVPASEPELVTSPVTVVGDDEFEHLAVTRSVDETKGLLRDLDQDPVDDLLRTTSEGASEADDEGDTVSSFDADADLDAPTRRSVSGRPLDDLIPEGFLPSTPESGQAPGKAQREPISELVTRQHDRGQSPFAYVPAVPPPAAAPATSPSSPPSSRSKRSNPPPLPREATPAPPVARPKPAARPRPTFEEVPESAPPARLDSASWMQEEARRRPDPVDGARLLISASEVRALEGNFESARALAEQAVRFAPNFEPALRLARAHATREKDHDRELELLREEARVASTEAAKKHALFIATERTAGTPTQEEFLREGLLGKDTLRAEVHAAATHLREASPNEPAPAIARSSVLYGALDDARLRLELRGFHDGESSLTAAVRRLREALSASDIEAASNAAEGFVDEEPLMEGALWLATLFGSQVEGDSRAPALLEMLPDDDRKARFLASLAMERKSPALLQAALARESAWSADERLALTALLGPVGSVDVPASDTGALACAVAGLKGALPPEALTGRSIAQLRLGRALAQSTASIGRSEIRSLSEKAHGTASPTMAAVEWLLWSSDGPRRELAEALSAHAGPEGSFLAAAALLAEFAKDPELAQELYKRVIPSDGPWEAAARSITPFDSATADLGQVAERLSDLRGAMLHLECALVPKTKTDVVLRHLEAAADQAPDFAVVPFLGELFARHAGDDSARATWLGRQSSNDAFLGPFQLMRQFSLSTDPEDLRAASAAAPKDASLRDLLEAKVPLSFEEKAAYREKSMDLSDPAAAVHLLEATLLWSDATVALRTARALAERGPSPMTSVVLERLETETGDGARLAEELIETARSTEDAGKRREAYERLADLDGLGRKDNVSALMWHRTILEDTPLHLSSLRYVENSLLREGRVDEYLPIAIAIARGLAKKDAVEVVAHAYVATRLQLAVDDTLWSQTREMSDLAYAEGDPGTWALRAHYNHARVAKDEREVLSATFKLAEAAGSSEGQGLLYVRAASAALHLGKTEEAEQSLVRATEVDPGDFVAWLELAELRDARSAHEEAAEAYENLARAFAVSEHALTAWHAAGLKWLGVEGMRDRAIVAFEHASNIDPTFEDVFARLSELYAEEGRAGDLAELLERRLTGASDDDERAHLEVELGRTLAELGDEDAARDMFRRALDKRPDNTHALSLYADLSAKRKDWDAAEQSWVRLARLLPTKDEQRAVYERLGDLYAKHSLNYARAEVAWREVLKRDEKNELALLRLVDVYRAQDNAAQAIETYEQYMALSEGPAVRLTRLVGLAQLHETTGRNPKKAEALLDAARKEVPGSPVILRAMAEFYARQRQGPAMNVLLDRAAGDARRVLAAGRPTRAAFETLALVSELRGRTGGARVIHAALAALDGTPSAIEGAGVRALDPRLDDLLAPEILSPAFRALLAQAGDAFDIASPLDTRRLGATAVSQQYRDVIGQIARTSQELGLTGLQIGMAARVGRVCLPCASTPPTLVVGESLLKAEDGKVRAFLVVRALKLVAARASALVRVPAQDLAILIAAWLRSLNPSWVAPGVDANLLAEAGRRLTPGLPRTTDPNFAVLALEAAAAIGNQAAQVGNAAVTWANRAALLAVGDPSVALEGLAWSMGQEGVPADEAGRAAWIAKTADARDLLSFAASDALLEARKRLGLPA